MLVKELIKNAELHMELSQSIVERVRSGKHAVINRRTNLMYILKNDFLQTNRCDFTIGKFVNEIKYKCLPKFTNYNYKLTLYSIHDFLYIVIYRK